MYYYTGFTSRILSQQITTRWYQKSLGTLEGKIIQANKFIVPNWNLDGNIGALGGKVLKYMVWVELG